MATANPFDLLGDNDYDDPSQLVARATTSVVTPEAGGKNAAAGPPSVAPAVAKLSTKPVPPAQAVKEAKSEPPSGRGGGRGGRGFGRGGGRGGGQFRDINTNEGSYNSGFSGGSSVAEDGEHGKRFERSRGGYGGPRAPYRGGRLGGYGNEETGDSERPRRQFERRSGTGRGTELKRDGAGRGNWGTPTDEVLVQSTEEITTEDKSLTLEKRPENEDSSAEPNKGDASKETEEKEPEDKEMTLEEYEKIREEKRKALLAMKVQERKVVPDKELESMQPLLLKKNNDDVFIKLGSEKDLGRRKENADKDDRVKKAVSINEFLKPAEGERYYSPGGRGRGRGHGDHGGFRGGFAGNHARTSAAPSIEDPGQFPTLSGK